MRINLALQGGGAHGAFTWGVVDRLLDQPNIEIAGISGTSAGAMNAAAIKCGYVENGIQGAKDKLRAYWEKLARYSPSADYQEQFFSFGGPFAGIWRENFKQVGLTPNLEQIDQFWSPYSSNPLDINPLRSLVKEHFDKAALRATAGPKLFVNATNVRTGKIKIFSGGELSHEALLASAALPSIFKAVEIDGEAYWDGGYTGNPALFPLIDNTDCEDIVIVHINPVYRDDLPKNAIDIENRVNEITFNSSLLRDLRHIDFILEKMKSDPTQNGAFKDIRIHSIADDDLMNTLSPSSKVFTNRALIEQLYNAGHVQAEAFIAQHEADIGNCSTFHAKDMFSAAQ